ncbi:tetratricopeptide repeat protein [Spirochaetota bacterium]
MEIKKIKRRIQRFIGKNKISIGIGTGILFIIILIVIISVNKCGKADSEISYYRNLIKEYPKEFDNYKKLSELYQKRGNYKRAKKYYDEYIKKREKYANQDEDLFSQILDKKNRQDTSYDPRDSGYRDNNITRKNTPRPRAKPRPKATPRPRATPTPIRHDVIKKIESADGGTDDKEKKAIVEFNAGYKAYVAKQYDESERRFKNSISHKDDYADPHSYLGSTYVRKKKYEDALSESREAIKYDDKNYNAYFNMGEVYDVLNDRRKAEEYFYKVIELKSDHFLAYYRLANIKFKNNQFNEAKGLYYKCLNLNPNFYKAYVNLGNTLVKLENPRTAQKAFEEAFKHPDFQKEKKTYSYVCNVLGSLLYNDKKYNNALAYYRKALNAAKDYKIYLNLGILYEKLEKYNTALSYYKSSLQLKPSHVAYHNLGTIYYKESDFSEAVRNFQSALEIQSDYVDSLVQLAKSYLKLGKESEAKLTFDKALKYDYSHSTAHIELARFWKDKGILEKAVTEAKLALEYEKDLESKLTHYNELGLIYQRFKLYDDAERSFFRAKEINPGNIVTLYNLADLYAEKEEFSRVKELYHTIIKINSSEYKAYELIIYTYLKMNDKEKAQEMLIELTKQKPDYSKRNELQKAIDTYKPD